MAAEVKVKLETPSSCCASWKNKYSKLEEKRNALRQAVKLLEQQIDKIQAQSKKVCDSECARADFERQEKEKESAARLILENEIATLKSEILSLKQNGDGNDEVKRLQALVSDMEREITRLKEAVQSEGKRADLEKKKAAEAQKVAEGERNKVESNMVKLEKERADKYMLQMEALRKEADEAKSKLASETVKLKEVNKKLQEEKQKVAKEKKRADLEKGKAEEQRKLAEANKKWVLEGKIYTESLSRQLEEHKRRIDEARDSKLVLELSLKLDEANKKLQLEKQKAAREKERADGAESKAETQRKIADMNLKKAMEEKSRADNLFSRLEEDKHKINQLEKQICELSSSRKLIRPYAGSSTESVELKLLKKELKLEKMKKKHSKQLVELERSRNSILQQELGRLKLEFDQFSGRLGLLQKSLSPRSEGLDGLEKNRNIINMPMSDMKNVSGSELLKTCLQSHKELLKPSFPANDVAGSLRQTVHQTAHLCPLPGGYCIEPITGIASKLESLLGGSTRTMLTSPALNSSTTSFSNRQLVGSQDKGALVEESAQPTVSGLSDEVTEMRSSENLAVVAENSIRGPVSHVDVGKATNRSKKRKMILDTVETIENLYLKEKKLHLQIEEKLAVLNGTVKKKIDKGFREGKFLLPNCLGSSDAKHDKHNKKRKISFQEKVVMQHPCDTRKPENRDEVKLQVHVNANLCRESSLNGIGGKMTQANGENSCRIETMEDFEKIADGDYMDLLNLDDAAFEEYYRVAMEIPLSPTLPEIEIPCDETVCVENAIPSVKETSCEELSNKEEKVSSLQGSGSIDIEISPKRSKFSGPATLDTSLLHKEENPANALDIIENVEGISNVKKASLCLSPSGTEVEISNPNTSCFKFKFEGAFDSLSNKGLEHCAVFCNTMDRGSISRTYYAVRACMARCSLDTQIGWSVREILLAISTEENLLAKEKVCAFFSLLMINFSVAALGKFGDYSNWSCVPCMDSFAAHVCEVMSDADVRILFAQLGFLDELLSLIENLLVDGCVKVLRDVSFGLSTGNDSNDNIHLDGSNVTLSSTPVSTEQLIAGSIILASVCSELDHIGFICETSFNILRARRLSNSLILSILHIFAYLGRDKYFSLSGYSLIMSVLKPIVRNIETLNLSGASVCNPLVGDGQIAFCRCTKCPFLEDAGNSVSMDGVTSLLLEKIKANNNVETVTRDREMCSSNCDVSGDKSDAFTTLTLSGLSDVLALLELISCYMGWEWTSIHIVPQLSKLLESSIINNLTSGVIILLGQLGRLGVEAFGYEDKKVDQLRSDLSAFLRHCITMEAALPIQIATVTALLSLVSVDFGTILQASEKLPAIDSHSVSTNLMRKWFSSLNKKQQDLSLNVLQTSK